MAAPDTGDTREGNILGLRSCAIAIVGPTASGKSALAQGLAERLEGEVLSADSMQIYQGMDIGTGKLRPRERTVAYHGIDLCAPDAPFSAALYQAYARECLKDTDLRGRRTVLCGGTGLYIRAAIDDFRFPHGDQADNPTRRYYTRIAEEQGADRLWSLLHDRDSASAALIHPNNVRRVVRAFEMLEEGSSYAAQLENLHSIKQVVPAVFVGLAVDPEVLKARIARRVDGMVAEGLVEEVASLLGQGLRASITAPQAIGYKEIVPYLDGTATLDESVEKIKVATNRYAKRQRTWFRSDPRIHWLDADSGDSEELLYRAFGLLGKIGLEVA